MAERGGVFRTCDGVSSTAKGSRELAWGLDLVGIPLVGEER